MKHITSKIQFNSTINLDFPFEKYCNLIIAVIPKEDIVGITEIRFVESFSHKKSQKNALAYYIPGQKGGKAAIEINITNLSKQQIPLYLYNFYPEIAALLLSEYIGHELGHHIHTFKRHGIKKYSREKFSDQYAKAVYFHYLKSRTSQILASYRRASWNILRFDKKARKTFSLGHKELIEWLEENKAEISFP